MRNAWVATSDRFATWIADLAPVRSDRGRLGEWLAGVLRLGEEQAIYRVEAAPAVAYRRQRDGDLVEHLDRRSRESGAVDLFTWTDYTRVDADGTRLRVVARLAYWTREGHIDEAEVDDAGQLLRGLRDDEDPLEAPGLMTHCAPLYGFGHRLRVDPSAPPPPRDAEVWFQIDTDIWLPWVAGILERVREPGARWRDNRALAERHTPRLNAFLAGARAATEAAGGHWWLEPELSRPDMAGWMLDDAGVRLDAVPPAN